MTGPVVLTLVVRDEADVLAVCLDYHLGNGVDLVLVTDHASEDATPDVLAHFARAGRVRAWRETGAAFRQDEWATAMARVAAREHDASWLLHGDADELWWPAHGDLRRTLAAVPASVDVLVTPRSNFLPSPGATEPFWRRMVRRDRRSVNAFGHPLPPKLAHRAAADVVVGPGGHTLRSACLGAPVAADGLEILHYPVRSFAQLVAKVTRGAAAAAANPAYSEEACATWRAQAAWHREGRLGDWFDAQLALADGAEPGRVVHDARVVDWMTAHGR